MPSNSRQLKGTQWTNYIKRLEQNESYISTNEKKSHISPQAASFRWNSKSVACLLKALGKWIHKLGDVDQEQSSFWKSISSEISNEHPWALQSMCQIKWRQLQTTASSYDTNPMSYKIEKPSFYYIIKDYQNRMRKNKERSRRARISTSYGSSFDIASIKIEEESDITTGEELADPDAIEDDPFSGVLDSQGNTIMRDVLLKIVDSLETLDLPLHQLAAKHGVEEAIIEWVKTNKDAVIKGSLRCQFCNRRILKRKDYFEHLLDCAQATSPANKANDITKEKMNILENQNDYVEKVGVANQWSPEVVAKMIKLFSKTCRSYISPMGMLRSGIWLEVYRVLKNEVNYLTPKMCSTRWQKLVSRAKEYHDKHKEPSLDPKIEEAPFYKAISFIIDLSETSPNSEGFGTPCTRFLDSEDSISNELLLPLPSLESIAFISSTIDEIKSFNSPELPSKNAAVKRPHSFILNTKDSEVLNDLDFDMAEQDNDSDLSSLIEFDLSENDFDSPKKNYPPPDSLEPSIHLFKEENFEELDEIGKTIPTLKGIERKANVILSRISQLEDETQAMKDSVDDKNIDQRFDELKDQFNQSHLQNFKLFNGMKDMLERHHKENLDAINRLTDAILGARDKIQ